MARLPGKIRPRTDAEAIDRGQRESQGLPESAVMRSDGESSSDAARQHAGPLGGFPDFQPHRLLLGAHAQTLAGAFAPVKLPAYTARREVVPLPDGDHVVLHDDCPVAWQPGTRVVLLVHGLGGSHESGYMRRIAAKLNARGIRAFRMDMRGCGAGAALARLPFHGGRSADVEAALQAIDRLCPGSPISLAGFSLGGNVILKMLGELGSNVPAALDRAVAFNPPLDLYTSVQHILQPANRYYQKYFLRSLLRLARDRSERLAETTKSRRDRAAFRQSGCRTILDFDQNYTAPICGFQNAEDYYRRSSAAPLVGAIRVPTLIVTAADDPLVPVGMFTRLANSPAVVTRLVSGGGHLGYIGRRGIDPDRRWMDWRVVDWSLADDPLRLVAQN